MLLDRFEKEDSLWGPYLSVVNGEKARRSDRRYWHLASNGTGLTEGEDSQTHITLWLTKRAFCLFIFKNAGLLPQVSVITRFRWLKRSPSKTQATERQSLLMQLMVTNENQVEKSKSVFSFSLPLVVLTCDWLYLINHILHLWKKNSCSAFTEFLHLK